MNKIPDDIEERCEAIYNTEEFFATRCPNRATVRTEEGSFYCEEHKHWDED